MIHRALTRRLDHQNVLCVIGSYEPSACPHDGTAIMNLKTGDFEFSFFWRLTAWSAHLGRPLSAASRVSRTSHVLLEALSTGYCKNNKHRSRISQRVPKGTFGWPCWKWSEKGCFLFLFLFYPTKPHTHCPGLLCCSAQPGFDKNISVVKTQKKVTHYCQEPPKRHR